LSISVRLVSLVKKHGIVRLLGITSSLFKKRLSYEINRRLPPAKRQKALENWYFKETGQKISLDCPQTFNEKIQWFKLYGGTPLVSQLSDKYRVREWVKERIGEKYLIPLLGCWDEVDDIDFAQLPQKFVLKCNRGCGYNLIVTDKSTLDIAGVKKKLKKWMSTDFAFVAGFEMHYQSIPRKITAEAYLENDNSDLFDYKSYCFNGKCEFIEFISGRGTGTHLSFYDKEWKQLAITSGTYPVHDIPVPKPDNLQELLHCVECLAEGFPHVRVDFYRLNDGRLYFGEMTFTPCSGKAHWQPENLNYELGQKFSYPGMHT